MLALLAVALFAQSPETNPGALWVTGGFAAAAGLSAAVNVITLFATRREVEGLERRQGETRAELAVARKEMTEELAEARKEMAEMERRLNSASEDRAAATHDRINDVLRAVSKLDGKLASLDGGR